MIITLQINALRFDDTVNLPYSGIAYTCQINLKGLHDG